MPGFVKQFRIDCREWGVNMDTGTLLTAAGTIVTVVGSNIALISWLRSDMKSFETEVRGWRQEIQKESRDFHGRLCAIEERNKKQ